MTNYNSEHKTTKITSGFSQSVPRSKMKPSKVKNRSYPSGILRLGQDSYRSPELSHEQKELQATHWNMLSRYSRKGYKLVKRPIAFDYSSEDSKPSIAGESNIHDTNPPEDTIIVPRMMNDRIGAGFNKLTPDGIAFLLTVEGCAKNLLLFILSQKVVLKDGDKDKGLFLYNQQTRDHFNEFCSLFGLSYTKGTIDQAKKDLVNKNIILNESTGRYYLNPLMFAGNEAEKRIVINRYCTQLLKKGKDPVFDFYPRYKH